MKALFINQFFLPDGAATAQLLGDVIEGIDHASVICGRAGYAGEAGRCTRTSTVTRVGAARFGHGRWSKIVSYSRFFLAALRSAIFRTRPAAVVTMTTPPGLSLIGAMVQALRASRHIIWEMDLYPDVAEELGMVRQGGPLARIIGWLTDIPRRRADAIVVLGSCMAERLARRNIPPELIHICENWADGSQIQPAPFHSGPDLRIIYAGNLGLAHDIETLVAALPGLEHGHSFLFSGGGPRRREFVDACSRFSWVQFQGYVDHSDLSNHLGWSDVGLVTQKACTVGTLVPSKAYGVMAAGRGVLFIGPAESTIGRMIDECGVGWHIDNGDVSGLISLLDRLRSDRAELRRVGRRAREVFESRYEKRFGVARFLEAAGLDSPLPTNRRAAPPPPREY